MDTSLSSSIGSVKASSSEYISEKGLRLRSYFRRRPVPFRRVLDLDLCSGSASFVLSASEEAQEATYVGDEALVNQFRSRDGLSLRDATERATRPFRVPPTEDRYNQNDEESEHYFPEDEEEEEYFSTVEERRRFERAKRKQAAQRLSDGEFLRNPTERSKAFSTRKDFLLSKLKELDTVCGSMSFALIICPEKEAAFYSGHPELVSQFFSRGLSSLRYSRDFNVRPFEHEETESNIGCSVPHCSVSRNTLSKWRLAALELFGFPDNIPMTLHACPESDRDQWIAELDLDPGNIAGKISVCSFHFREGYPTEEFPYPTELLSESASVSTFQGKRASSWRPEELPSAPEDFVCDILEDVLQGVNLKISEKEESRRRHPFTQLLVTQKRRKRLPGRPSKCPSSSVHLPFYKKILRSYAKRQQRATTCMRCNTKCTDAKALFEHVRVEHFRLIPRSSYPIESHAIQQPSTPHKDDTLNIELSSVERGAILEKLYPCQIVPTKNPNKKYVCGVCQSQFDLHGIFVHMKQMHRGMLCQFCLRLFTEVHELEKHLRKEHRVSSRYYHSFESFTDISGSRYHFLCGQCNKMVRLSDLKKSLHKCIISSNNNNNSNAINCPHCERVFCEPLQLEMHLVNGWCRGLNGSSSSSKEISFKDASKLYKALTGKHLSQSDVNKHRDSSSILQEKKEDIKEFSVSDRQILMKYHSLRSSNNNNNNNNNTKRISHFIKSSRVPIISSLPLCGNIYVGARSKGISSGLRKEIKEEGYKYTDVEHTEITRHGKNLVIHTEVKKGGASPMKPISNLRRKSFQSSEGSTPTLSNTEDKENNVQEAFINGSMEMEAAATTHEVLPRSKEDKLARLQRDYEEILEDLRLLREAITDFSQQCLVCQQAKLVCVDSIYLLTHIQLLHKSDPRLRLSDPSTSINRMKRYIKDTKAKEILFSYQEDKDLRIDFYSCSYCTTSACLTNEDLFLHLEKEHSQKVLSCNLCQSIFLNYGSFISHVCYGPPSNSAKPKPAKFNCKVCLRQDLSSFLIFQNHLRRDHNMCEICLKYQGSQESLYSHCLQHSQELMCMKCFLAYDEHDQFRKHLYFKHYEECRICGLCYQKTWPHVYHFCIPNLPSSCEVCDKKFVSTKQYRVHMRTHTKIHPYACTSHNCSKSFISKQLLWKHQIRRHPDLSISAKKALEDRRSAKEVLKYNASSIQVVRDVQSILSDLISSAIEPPPPTPPKSPSQSPSPPPADEKDDKTKEENEGGEEPLPEPEPEMDPLDAAVASIMGAEGEFNTPKSPVKPSLLLNNAPSCLSPSKGGLHNNASSLLNSLNPHVPDAPPPKAESPPQIMHPSEYFSKRRDAEDSDEAASPIKKKSAVFPIRGASSAPVVGGIWNQDLLFVSKGPNVGKAKVRKPGKPGGGLKVMRPITEGVNSGILAKYAPPSTTPPTTTPASSLLSKIPPKPFTSLDPNSITKKLGTGGWEVCLSESSGDSDNEGPDKPKKVKMIDRIIDPRIPVLDHDYCYESYMLSLEPPKPPELSEMDKILSNVALGVMDHVISPEPRSPILPHKTTQHSSLLSSSSSKKPKHKKNKKESKKKKKKKRKSRRNENNNSSSDSEDESRRLNNNNSSSRTNMTTPFMRKTGPKPKYHTPLSGAGGVTAGTGRIMFNSSSDEEDDNNPEEVRRNGMEGGMASSSGTEEEICSSDLDTDFSADENVNQGKEEENEEEKETNMLEKTGTSSPILVKKEEEPEASPSPPPPPPPTLKPTLKLKIKLPPGGPSLNSPVTTTTTMSMPISRPHNNKLVISKSRKRYHPTSSSSTPRPSKKMRGSLSRGGYSSSSSSSVSESEASSHRGRHQTHQTTPIRRPPVAPIATPTPTPRSNSKQQQPRASSAYVISDASGTSGLIYNSDPERLYCVCQCPHDEVSEMIGCDGPDCQKEWFHFECVGILVPPAGKWYCPECSARYKIRT